MDIHSEEENLPEVCRGCSELDCWSCDFGQERFPMTEEEENDFRIRLHMQRDRMKMWKTRHQGKIT